MQHTLIRLRASFTLPISRTHCVPRTLRSVASSSMRAVDQSASNHEAAVKERARAAVLGALLADAATMPLHWIYDVEKLNGLLGIKDRGSQPEFFPDSSCPFYQYPLARCHLTDAGDEAYAVLRYAAAHADMDGPGLTEHLYGYFKGYEGRLNGTAKHLVAAWEEGKRFPAAAAEDSQAHAIVKVPIVVARYGGTPELLSRVEEAVRTQQDSQTAVAVGQAAAQVLEQLVVQGSSVAEALHWALQPGNLQDDIRQQLATHLADTSVPLHSMVWEVTKAPHCGLPGAFINALYCAATSSGYVDNVQRNIMVGGDNCSRILYGGALWAAAEGEGALPQAWKQQMRPGLYSELEKLTDQLLR